MAERDRFPAAYEWRRLMSRMSDEQCGQFWRAIYAWQIDGEEYTGDDPVVGISFEFALPFMRNCRQQYEAVCERNRTNGKKGGRPRKEQAAENPVGFLGYENTGIKNPEETQTKPRKPDIDIDIDIDSDSGNIPVLSDDNNKDISPAGAVVVAAGAKETVFRRYREAISPSMSRGTEQELTAAAEAWPADVVLSAIDAAIDAGKPTGAYVCGVLRNYRKAGVQTMDDVLQARRAHQSGRAGLPKDDIAHMFGDGVPQFIDDAGLMFAQMQTEGDTQKVITANFPPFKGVL